MCAMHCVPLAVSKILPLLLDPTGNYGVSGCGSLNLLQFEFIERLGRVDSWLYKINFGKILPSFLKCFSVPFPPLFNGTCVTCTLTCVVAPHGPVSTVHAQVLFPHALDRMVPHRFTLKFTFCFTCSDLEPILYSEFANSVLLCSPEFLLILLSNFCLYWQSLFGEPSFSYFSSAN